MHQIPVSVEGRDIEVTCEEGSTVAELVKLVKLHFTLETLAENRSTKLIKLDQKTVPARRASIAVGEVGRRSGKGGRVSYFGDTEQECELADDDDSDSQDSEGEQDVMEEEDDDVSPIRRGSGDEGERASPATNKYDDHWLFLRQTGEAWDRCLDAEAVFPGLGPGEKLLFKRKPIRVTLSFTQEFLIDATLSVAEVHALASREFGVPIASSALVWASNAGTAQPPVAASPRHHSPRMPSPRLSSPRHVSPRALGSPRSKARHSAFGVVRGACRKADPEPCECAGYQPGVCSNCGHYPAQHASSGHVSRGRSLSESPSDGEGAAPPAPVSVTLERDRVISQALPKDLEHGVLKMVSTVPPCQLGFRTFSTKVEGSGERQVTVQPISIESSPIRIRGSPLGRHMEQHKAAESPRTGRLKRAISKVFSSQGQIEREREPGSGGDDVEALGSSPLSSSSIERARSREHVFGRALASFDSVPAAIDNLVSSIYQGLQTEGIFRKSGNQERINQFKAEADAGVEQPAVLESMDFHDKACALKQYLQSLPECLLTNEFYSLFKTAAKMTDTELQLDYLRCLVASLPAPHRILLCKLTVLLRHVTKYSEINLMGNDNLAIVFGPILMTDKESADATEFLRIAERQKLIVETLLEFSDLLVSEEDCSDTLKMYRLSATSSYRAQTPLELDLASGDVLHVFKEDQGLLFFDVDGKVGVLAEQVAKAMTRPYDHRKAVTLSEESLLALSQQAQAGKAPKKRAARTSSKEEKKKKKKGV